MPRLRGIEHGDGAYAHTIAGSEREAVRDGRTVWVEEWRVTVSSVDEPLELQRGLGVPVLLEGGHLTMMAKSA